MVKNFIISQLKLYNSYVTDTWRNRKKYNIKGRNPNFPEDISETLIMHILKNKDPTCTRDTKSGDLWSESEKKIECKCFTSNGPISFGPNSKWDTIYFLDGRKYYNNRFTLYKSEMSNAEFNKLKINKKQTYGDVCKSGKRPRIGWNALHKQMKYSVVFDDTIDNI